MLLKGTAFLFALLSIEICGYVSSRSTTPDPLGANATEVFALANRSVNLPCDISLPNNHESVTLVLWYREDLGTPVFSYEVSKGVNSDSADVWSDQQLLGDRAQFRPEAFPALLRIHDISARDAGQYRCRVDFNEAPTRNSLINLTVIVPPTSLVIFDEHGTSRNSIVGPYEVGNSVKLVCDAFKGSPPPTVYWFLEDQLLDDSYHMIANGTVRNELILPKLDKSYLHKRLSCKADNTELAPERVQTVYIDLNFPPTLVQIANKDELLIAGRASEIRCVTSGSRPPAHIEWFLNERRIEKFKQDVETIDANSTSSVLSFIPHIKHNGQTLKCKASNPQLVGQAQILDEMTLRISYAPRVNLAYGLSITSDNIYEGGDVYFDCHIQAVPMHSQIKWYFNNISMSHNPAEGIIMTNQSLVMQGIDRTKSGFYSCEAMNKIGRGRSRDMFLNVKYAPVCSLDKPTVYGVAKSEMVEVFCNVDANPGSQGFDWSFNNSADFIQVPPSRIVVLNATRSKLSYTPLTNKDYGTLMCSARNEVGKQREPCVFHIILAVSPDPVSNCTVINKSSETFHVKCNPGFDGGMEQYFIVTVVDRMENVVYYNETTKVPDVHVNKLKEGTSYLTTITPANNKGVGTSSYIIVDTLQQPAVELTQAEEANRNDDKASLNTIATASETDENIPDGEWAVLTGTLFGTLGCFTILLVASLVIRFCVCPSMQHHGNGPADWQKADLSASGENPDTYDEPGAENTLIRKGILKRARSNDGIMDEDVAYDAELEFMNRIAQENFPEDCESCNKNDDSMSDEADMLRHSNFKQHIYHRNVYPRHSCQGKSSSPNSSSTDLSRRKFRTDDFSSIPQELSATMTLQRKEYNMKDPRHMVPLTAGGTLQVATSAKKKSSPASVLKRKRESIV